MSLKKRLVRAGGLLRTQATTRLGGAAAANTEQMYFTRVAARTTVGTQSITFDGLTNTPKAIMLYVCSAEVDSTLSTHGFGSLGFTDGTNQRCVMGYEEDAVANQQSDTLGTDDFICWVQDSLNPTRTDFLKISISSLDAGGCTLSVDLTDGNAYFLHVFAFNCENAFVGDISPAAVDATQTTVSGLGFQPDFMIGRYTDRILEDLTRSEGQHNLGVVAGGVQRFIASDGADGGASMNHKLYDRDDFTAFAVHRKVDNSKHYLTWDEWTADGFKYTTHEEDGIDTAGKFCYLAMELSGNAKVVNFDIPAVLLSDPISGYGFQPSQLLLCLMGYQTPNVGQNWKNDDMGFMLTYVSPDGTPDVMLNYSERGIPDGNAHGWSEAGQFIYFRDYDDAAEGFSPALADFGGYDADGFTIDWTNLGSPFTQDGNKGFAIGFDSL